MFSSNEQHKLNELDTHLDPFGLFLQLMACFYKCEISARFVRYLLGACTPGVSAPETVSETVSACVSVPETVSETVSAGVSVPAKSARFLLVPNQWSCNELQTSIFTNAAPKNHGFHYYLLRLLLLYRRGRSGGRGLARGRRIGSRALDYV